MSSVFSSVEAEIACQFDRAHCVLVGSGTAALFCVFQALQERPDEDAGQDILFPNITCETAVNAAIFAGFRPRFCDVATDSYLMDPESASRSAQLGTIVAAVPTHIFGHLLDVAAMQTSIGSRIPCIEDAAQAYGGSLGNRKAGSMGLASIVSFGEGKLLDCGGGGALMCDEDQFAARCREVAERLPEDCSKAAEVRNHLMKTMLLTKREFRDDQVGLHNAQRRALFDHRDGYLLKCRETWARDIGDSLMKLPGNVQNRTELMQMLDEVLKESSEVRLPKRSGTPSLWRYTFLVNDDATRTAKVQSLRALGLNVSQLFVPCTRKFGAQAVPLSTSEEVAKRVINLHMPRSPTGNAAVVTAIEKVFQ